VESEPRQDHAKHFAVGTAVLNFTLHVTPDQELSLKELRGSGSVGITGAIEEVVAGRCTLCIVRMQTGIFL
jgi:hypothetical protein